MNEPGVVRQVALLLIAVGVPGVLLLLGWRRLLLQWVGATLFVQVFDTRLLTNLPAGRIVGLLWLPAAIVYLPTLFRNRSSRLALLNLLYLLGLAVAFGWLMPWPDITGQRTFFFRADGKALVYLIRTISDLSLSALILCEVQNPLGLAALRKGLLAGALATCLMGIAQAVTKEDPYLLITGLGESIGGGRMRGLSYEPRGLGLAAVYGLFLALAKGTRRSRGALGVAGICAVGLVVSGSFSGLGLFVAGTLVVTVTGLGRTIGRKTVTVGMAIGGLAAAGWTLAPALRDRVAFYLDPRSRLGDEEPRDLVERVAFKLDVFDASALLFFRSQPVYAITGTGAGLVCLPASYYVPPGVYQEIWTQDMGLNSMPTHGLLLEVSNGGVVSVAIFALQAVLALRATSTKRRLPQGWEMTEWVWLGRAIRLGIVFYVVQNSVSPVWAVFQGLLFAGAKLGSRCRHAEEPAEVHQTAGSHV